MSCIPWISAPPPEVLHSLLFIPMLLPQSPRLLALISTVSRHSHHQTSGCKLTKTLLHRAETLCISFKCPFLPHSSSGVPAALSSAQSSWCRWWQFWCSWSPLQICSLPMPHIGLWGLIRVMHLCPCLLMVWIGMASKDSCVWMLFS